MRSIQDVGREILSGSPAPFYIFVGCEYGIKYKYLQILKSHYGSYIECASVSEVLSSMKVKSLIPKPNMLYIVRYDEAFLSQLSSSTAKSLHELKIRGTIVCIYESQKHTDKLSKYLDDYMVSIDQLDDNYIIKYIHQDFPNIELSVINNIVYEFHDYYRSYLLCSSISCIDSSTIRLSSNDIKTFFSTEYVTQFNNLEAIKHRDYIYVLKNICDISDPATIFFDILQAMVEIDKIKHKSHLSADERSIDKLWPKSELWAYFQIAYDGLKFVRSHSVDIRCVISTIITMMAYSPIPVNCISDRGDVNEFY